MINSERFTRKSIKIADSGIRIASEMGHTYVGSEHILLALVNDRECYAGRLLTEAGASFNNVYDEVIALVGRGVPSRLNYRCFTTALKRILENSYNIPAVWLLDQIGTKVGFKSAEDAGLPVEKSDDNLSLAIGGMKKGVSPLQMTQAYTSFANDGKMSKGHFITKIEDASGKVIVDTKPEQKRLWSSKVTKEMTSMMLGVYTDGTGVSANPYGFKVAGKTGTTEVSGEDSSATNATDSWAIAYTPDVVVTTWMGYDKTDASHTLPIYLSQTAGPLMKQTLEQVLPNTPNTPFNVKSVREQMAEKQAAKERQAAQSQNANDVSDGITDKIRKGTQDTIDSFNRGAKKAWSDLIGNF